MPLIYTRFILGVRPPKPRTNPLKPIADRCSQIFSQIKDVITFIPKAWAWVEILWTAHIAIEGFNHDGSEIVELLLIELQFAGPLEHIPIIVAALMFLEPEILTEWLDGYIPGQASNYTHPEAVEEFEDTYERFIRRSKKASEHTESSFACAENPNGGEQTFCA